jgi:large exoprotein involved in heme utilization and adhesion
VNNLEASKTAAKLSSGDIATNATHQHAIDTLGFDYASIDVVFEPVAAAGTNSSVAVALKLQQGDTTSSYDDYVTAFVGRRIGRVYRADAGRHQQLDCCAF